MKHRNLGRGSEILPFPPADARKPRRLGQEATGEGTVVLFTGVRYERLPDAPAAPLVLVSEPQSLSGSQRGRH